MATDSLASATAAALDAAPSFWAHKPWWCQPWTIVVTGLVIVAGSWWWPHRWWISLPLALGVLGWWGLFLLLVPAAWRAEQQQLPEAAKPGAQR
ncbi:MAG: DUF6737 family protein [Cyanobium sp.]